MRHQRSKLRVSPLSTEPSCNRKMCVIISLFIKNMYANHIPVVKTSLICKILQVEISHLKARQGGLQEEIHKLQHSAQSASVSPSLLPVSTTSSTTSSSSTFLSRPIGSHQDFHRDEMDLSDVLWSQQQINRLSSEVTRLEAEVAHWRRMSQVFRFRIRK